MTKTYAPVLTEADLNIDRACANSAVQEICANIGRLGSMGVDGIPEIIKGIQQQGSILVAISERWNKTLASASEIKAVENDGEAA